MVIIFGLGFTGQRLACRLLRRGERVFAAVRDPARFESLANAGVTLTEFDSAASVLPRGETLVHLIPPLPQPENERLRDLIEAIEPTRGIYISSTGVYGGRTEVDAETPAEPVDERGRRRLEEEHWISSHIESTLILRAAAIYGPGRGVHASLREGKSPRGSGSGVVSRIHVEDLAALIEAGMDSDLTGAWPVADDHACSTDEIVAWCCARLGIPPPEGVNSPSIAGRRVDGSAIRGKLGIELKYPSWEAGIPACLEEEESLRPPKQPGRAL